MTSGDNRISPSGYREDLRVNGAPLVSFYDGEGRLISSTQEFKSRFGLVAGSHPYIWDLYKEIPVEDWRTALALPSQLFDTRDGQRQLFLVSLPKGTAILELEKDTADLRLVQPSEDDREALLHQAMHDALTGLPNRRAFSSGLAQALKTGHGAHVALLLIDLDDFKPVNDTMGHSAGDIVLQETASRIRQCTGLGENAFRLAGDEFAVIKPGCISEDEAKSLAQRLVDTLRQPFECNGITLFLGCSVGVAIAPRDGSEIEELMKTADIALYAAKRNGRGRAVSFEPSMLQVLEQREVLRRSLRLALEREEFFLEFQPIVRTSGDIVGFEALLRWRHPLLGVISPTSFIPMAEADGLMPEIGGWVLRQACTEARTWPVDLSVAVNVSPAEFLNSNLTDRVSQTLDDVGLDAERLELEITESVLLERTSDNLDTLNTLNVLGIRISLDDFGTQYSSLSYLKNFPFDTIKIDKYFVSDLVSNQKSRTIVSSVIAMAHGLGMRVVAEGVEVDEQIALLRDLSCDRLQGFALGMPMQAGKILEFLATRRSQHQNQS